MRGAPVTIYSMPDFDFEGGFGNNLSKPDLDFKGDMVTIYLMQDLDFEGGYGDNLFNVRFGF